MSNEQIPTAAELGAVRARLWHQAVPESPEAARADEEQTAALMAEAADDSAGAAADESLATAETAPSPEDADAPAAEAGSDTEDGSDEVAGDAVEQGSEKDGSGRAPAEIHPALLTTEAAREFLEECGLLQFQPLAQMAGAPAPTLVEATLGRRAETLTMQETETARSLLARLVADGSAVPLNLLGAPTTTAETPDYVASAAAFAYVFTLRGDKTWKQLPATSGANKVSPLAVNTYALLVENGPQSAYALTGELGKGLTETAVLRALSELWQQLRVIPVAQPAGKPTVWEPVTTRLTKQIKAGANAGQPTALSALISMYLRQAILATEEEVATFLSPLAARSRVRDVLHALVASKQMEEMVIEGRHHLHIAGELPEFARPVEEERPVERKPRAAKAELTGEGRIKRFEGGKRPGPTDRGVRSKPFAAKKSVGGASRFTERRERPGGDRPAFGRPRREQGEGRPAERRFDRPWQEDAAARRPRRDAEGTDAAGEARGGGFGREEREGKPRKPWNPEGRPAFGRKGGFGGGKPGGAGFAARGGDRPAFARRRPQEGSEGEQRRPFAGADRRPSEGGAERPERRERGAWAPPRQGGGRPPFAGRRTEEDGERRPANRKPFGGGGFKAGPPRPRRDDDRGGERGTETSNFRPRREGAAEGGGRPPFRRFDERPAGRPFGAKRAGGPGAGGRPNREGSGPRREGSAAGRPPRKPFGEGGASRPRAGAAGEGAKRGGPFDKFMGPARGGVKPWGKRPPARKTRPAAEDEA